MSWFEQAVGKGRTVTIHVMRRKLIRLSDKAGVKGEKAGSD